MTNQNYEAMGMAAMLPGMQHMLDLMQQELDRMRAALGQLQNGTAKRKPGRPKTTEAVRQSLIRRFGWSDDPEERRADMHRRMAKRKAGPKNTATRLGWSDDPEERRAEMHRRMVAAAKKSGRTVAQVKKDRNAARVRALARRAKAEIKVVAA